MPHDYVKQVQVTAASGAWLLPKMLAFGNAPIVSTPSRNYTSAELPHLISLIGEEAGARQILAILRKNSSDLSLIQSVPVNVPFHNWYGVGVQTSERYKYDKEIKEGFNEAPTTTYFGDGDGVVNSVSSRAVETVWPRRPDSVVESKSFSNCTHFDMLQDDRVLDALTAYLRDANRVVFV